MGIGEDLKGERLWKYSIDIINFACSEKRLLIRLPAIGAQSSSRHKLVRNQVKSAFRSNHIRAASLHPQRSTNKIS